MNEPIYERMQQLIRQIRQADTAYYKHDAPIMSDLEYDRLIDDLVALEEDSGVILSNSPTQHVAGETLETLAEVRHTKPMLSAAKTKSVDDLTGMCCFHGRWMALRLSFDMKTDISSRPLHAAATVSSVRT